MNRGDGDEHEDDVQHYGTYSGFADPDTIALGTAEQPD